MASIPRIFRNRIRVELADVMKDKQLYGIYVVPDEGKMDTVHALITGPEGTPYQNGFFYFILNYPKNYPHAPPKVKLLTTDNGRVRFNPNLYACGKVCLSIIGTWAGPGWSPVMTTKTVLVSIQSLMNEQPYYNEPGRVRGRDVGQSQAYNRSIKRETMRVATVGMVENALDSRSKLPQVLKDVVIANFIQKFDDYLDRAGQIDSVPEVGGRKTAFSHMGDKLKALKSRIEKEIGLDAVSVMSYESLAANYSASIKN